MKRKQVITAAAAAVALAAAAVGGAAIAPAAAGFVGATFAGGHGAMPAAFLRGHAGDLRIDGWIAFAEAELAITETQRPQWEALAAAVRDNVGSVQEALKARHGPMNEDENGRRSAVEHLDAITGMAEVGLAALRSVSPPFKALYAVLSEEQRGTADRLLDHRRHRGRMHR